jgi:hypothetical protein
MGMGMAKKMMAQMGQGSAMEMMQKMMAQMKQGEGKPFVTVQAESFCFCCF